MDWQYDRSLERNSELCVLVMYIPIMENIETADFADAINRELYSRSVQIRNYLHHAEGTKH